MTIVLLLFLLTPAAAGGVPLPPRPEWPGAVADECRQPVGLRPGAPVPPSLLGPEGLAACAGLVLPISDYDHLEALEAWGDTVASLARLQAAGSQAQLDLARWQIDHLQVQLGAARTEAEANRRRAAWGALGGAVGGAAVALAAGAVWAWGQQAAE